MWCWRPSVAAERFEAATRAGQRVTEGNVQVAFLVGRVTAELDAQREQRSRMIEREHALVATPVVEPVAEEKPRRGGKFWSFLFGFILGAAALFGAALFVSLRNL